MRAFLWAEAWKESSKNFEIEKAAFVEERQRFDVLRSDMTTELHRLESELATISAARIALEERLNAAERTAQELRLTLIKEESQRQALESEVTMIYTHVSLASIEKIVSPLDRLRRQ